MKKLLAIILSVCLLLAAIPMAAFASAPVATGIVMELTGAPVTVYPGQTFSVSVNISENSGIYAWRSDLTFNSEYFDFVSASASGNFVGNESIQSQNSPNFSYNKTASNKIRMLWDNKGTDNFTANGTVATITFKAKETVPTNTYNFGLTFIDGTKIITENPYATDITIANSKGLSVNVEQIAVSSVEILEKDVVENYYIGDSLKINSISIKVTYNNGDEETITTGYETSYDFSTAGTKTVTVNYGGKSDTFSVTVASPSITLSDNAETVIVGEKHTVTVTTVPADAQVSWVSSKTSVATVDNGVITAVAEGEATITASFIKNGITYSADCVITVIPVSIVSVEIDEIDYENTYFIDDELVINSISLKVTYNNEEVEYVEEGYTTNYDFSTAGEKQVKISYEGFDNFVTATVKTPAVTLNKTSAVIIEGKTETLTIDTVPAGVQVTWESDDEDIITVANGVITAKTVGTATVTVSFEYNGTIYSAECEITVKRLLGDIDDSGEVDISDLALMKLYLVGAMELTEKQLDVANVNRSESVNVTDLAQLKLYLAGAITNFEDLI